LRSSAQQLDDAVVRPWGLRRGGLVLVTCQEVSALPWGLLPSLASTPVTLARSLTSFARRIDGRDRDAGRPHAVHVSVGPSLPRAVSEGESVTAAWRARGSTVELANPSSARGVIEALARDQVVHVGAHGTHQVQSPLFSSLALHDGPAFAHELQGSGVAADHVVLSACDIGSAVARPGEEQLGLAAAVHALGARSVVAAVSPVPDDVAAELMVRHHEGLAGGGVSDEALARAIAETDPVAASFVHLGGLFDGSR
jgi:CHAT domain-containing protein